MRDDIKPPVPVKEAPMAVPPPEPAQPTGTPAAPAPASDPTQAAPKRQSGTPVLPIIFAVIIFMALTAAAYAVFRGM